MPLAGYFVTVSKKSAEFIQNRLLSMVSCIVNILQDYVCGHLSYLDTCTLLQWNQLWNENFQKLLSSIIERCPNSKAFAVPLSSHKVSIAGNNRQINNVVCIDQFSFIGKCLFHIMDFYFHFSVAQPVESTVISNDISNFENIWISNFWLL